MKVIGPFKFVRAKFTVIILFWAIHSNTTYTLYCFTENDSFLRIYM